MRTVVALYDRFEDAQHAIEALNEQGFNREDINLVANDEQGEFGRNLEGSSGVEGAATGAGIGAVLGGLGGLLVGLGALAIPGIGPVLAAGPIVSTLAGAGVGAVAGGLIGALVDLGIPEEHANYYAEGIRRGGTLVTVRTEDHLAEDARTVMNRFNPVDIDTRAREWRNEGWRGFREDDETHRGVGTDLNTTENAGGERLGENYPSSDLELDRDRELTSDYEPSTSGVNTGIPVTGDDEDEEYRERMRGTDEVTRMDEHMRDDVFGRDRAGMGDNDIPVTGGTVGQVDNRMSGYSNLETDTDWSTFDDSFRSDYQTRYAMTGYDYEYYAPAYRYGYDLAHNDTYRGYDWERLEPEARRDWENRGLEGAWDDVKDAVRHAWESITR